MAQAAADGVFFGFCRYDGATAGTFPAGVVAADGGVLSIWRQTSTRLLQQLAG